ncbi:MAG: hypothetical protein GX616_18495 [Planctomycetes bacterium]|nr:hypothetical protein [Planctomycetota bacterium]
MLLASPLFVDPDGPDNDPATWEDNNYRLSASSPCVDTGTNAVVEAGWLDLDQLSRIVGGTPSTVDMGAYEHRPVQPVAWLSVRLHGTPSTPYAIELDPSATGTAVTSETRNGGIQRIEVDFSDDVLLLDSLAISATDADTPPNNYTPTSVSMLDDDTLAIEFASGVLPDQKCYTIDLGSSVAYLVGDIDCKVRGLVGDVSNNGVTNFHDMSLIKPLNGQQATEANACFDVTLDGVINYSDMAFVMGLNGNSATCP